MQQTFVRGYTLLGGSFLYLRRQTEVCLPMLMNVDRIEGEIVKMLSFSVDRKKYGTHRGIKACNLFNNYN
jgi:hypothetical protein